MMPTPKTTAKTIFYRVLLPALLIAGVLAATLLGAGLLRTTKTTNTAHPVADVFIDEALPSRLDAVDIAIAKQTGLWLGHVNGADVLVQRALKKGVSHRVDVCALRKKAAHNPNGIYPIHILPTWHSLSHKNKKQLPVIVGGAVGKTFSGATITGNAQGKLLIQPNKPNTKLVFAHASNNNTNPQQHSIPPNAKGVWLLWQPINQPATPNFTRYQYGIYIQRQARSGNCKTGGDVLVFSLYAINPKHNNQPKASVWVQSKHGRLLRIPASSHKLTLRATQDRPLIEDQRLFEQLQHHGLVTLDAKHKIQWAPSDILRSHQAKQAIPSWNHIDYNNPNIPPLLKALYRTDNGRFVLQQLKAYNQQQNWLALRLRLVLPNQSAQSALATLATPNNWSAQYQQQQLHISQGMPHVTARLFNAIPMGWSNWLRVQGADMPSTTQAAVQLQTTLPHNLPAGAVLDVISLGKLQRVAGAAAIQTQQAFCLSHGCVAKDMLWRTRLQLKPTTKQRNLTLFFTTEPRFNQLQPQKSQALQLQLRNGKIIWRAPRLISQAQKPIAPAVVNISSRNGTLLFNQQQATHLAYSMGIAAVMGLNQNHHTSVAGNLGRLAQHGYSRVAATTTINAQLQSTINQIVDCVGLREGDWNPKTQSCTNAINTALIPAKRRAKLVWLDAKNGDILAAATSPNISPKQQADDILAFSQFNPVNSPLQMVWQHTGDNTSNPGSAFKLVDALALEKWAQGKPKQTALLQGAPISRINTIGSHLGFSMAASCYPKNCIAGHSVPNFKRIAPIRYAKQGRFGLQQALQHSVNTWFAWAIERTDQTAHKHPNSIALGHAALAQQRPLLAMARKLGFEQRSPLDGNLFPKNFAWRGYDYLQTTPSRFDNIHNVSQIRHQAIGQQTQVTVLQMAQVAAAIATGHITQPRLLLQLNGKAAQTSQPKPLNIALTRIRNAMRAVVSNGTAKSSFAADNLRHLHGNVLGKTGTAQIHTRKKQRNNIAWFVGYIKPYTLSTQQHNHQAFAVSVSYTDKKGGQIAKIIAQAILALQTQNQHEPVT